MQCYVKERHPLYRTAYSNIEEFIKARMKPSSLHLFLLFSPFPLEMLPQNVLTQLLQARSKSV